MTETHEWNDRFDTRQLQEIAFAETYADRFAHGTDGHHRLVLIAKMSMLLTQQEGRLARLNDDALIEEG